MSGTGKSLGFALRGCQDGLQLTSTNLYFNGHYNIHQFQRLRVFIRDRAAKWRKDFNKSQSHIFRSVCLAVSATNRVQLQFLLKAKFLAVRLGESF